MRNSIFYRRCFDNYARGERMSRFSGKCDLYDTIEMIHCDSEEAVQEFIDNAEFYIWIGSRRHRLNITNRKELALYYPYIISMSACSNGYHNITLSGDCFIDREERERLEISLGYILKDYRRYKRKKLKFTYDNYIGEYKYSYMPEYKKELIRRVEKDGEKASIDGVYSLMHEYYRKEWYDTLVELGWTEEEAFRWVYRKFFCSEEDRNKRFKIYEDLKNGTK